MKFVECTLVEAIRNVPPGCLAIILSHPSKRSRTCDELIANANPIFRKEDHYMISHVGLAESDKPYIVIEWCGEGQGSLERRWLAQKITSRLEQMSAAKHWRILLDEFCNKEQLAIAEDLYRSTCDRLDGSSNLSSFSISANNWSSIDVNKEVRTKHQLGYRDWVNANPDEMTSLEIERRLYDFAQSNQCEFDSFDIPRLQELGLNLLLAVGQASVKSPSRLIVLTKNWRPNDPTSKMLVGKGVTFDTGGINVKAHENFVNCMKNDMGGAALMAHLFMALVESGYQQPLALVIPACENLVDASAMKPGSVITSYSGKRVMVEHTDAEGRLILADALAYGNDLLRPASTLVAATLTTASLRQFTNFFTPVHFANQALQKSIRSAGEEWGEGFVFWDAFLPFHDSNIAKVGELTNMGRMPKDASMGGGSNVAAHFLKNFCPSPMTHFDIFASAWNWSGDYPGSQYGATGAPFNSLFEVLVQQSS